MEPGNQQYEAGYGEQWPREVGGRGWTPPPLPAAQHGRVHPLSRARTWLIVLAALVTELIVIVAADNQWVSDKIVRNEQRTNNVALRSLANSWLTYTWRLSPRHGANANEIWGSQVALVLAVLVVTALLVVAVVRGPITFWRAFIGTWMAVIVATLVGGFVRGLIEPFSKLQLPKSGRLTRAVFGGFGVNPATVAAGFALGLVVATVAAIVAVASRRVPAPVAEPTGTDEQQAPYQPPEQPPPFYGNETAETTQPPPAAGGDDATARYRPIDADEDLDRGPERH